MNTTHIVQMDRPDGDADPGRVVHAVLAWTTREAVTYRAHNAWGDYVVHDEVSRAEAADIIRQARFEDWRVTRLVES